MTTREKEVEFAASFKEAKLRRDSKRDLFLRTLKPLISKFGALPPKGTLPVPIPPRLAGVYFLLQKGLVCYVGQSYDVIGRLRQHSDSPQERKEFDEVVYLPWDGVSSLIDLEANYIRELKPMYNRETRWRRYLPPSVRKKVG